MKILVAVESCQANRYLHQAMLDTWLADLPNEIDFRFFIGGLDEPKTLEEWVPCLDTYEGLAMKTKGACRWAYERGYDYVFKCDTDTVVNSKRLLNSGFNIYDYVGAENADNLPPSVGSGCIKFASGGAGYWLSKKAIEIISQGRTTDACGEDVYAALMLRERNIHPVWHEGYRWRPGSKIEGATTFHLSSALKVKYRPELMYEYFEKILLDK
jgi:hypothetical protein